MQPNIIKLPSAVSVLICSLFIQFCIVTTEESWFGSLQRQGIVPLSELSRMAQGPIWSPAPYVPGSLGVKTTVRDVDYSCSSGAGIKNEWSYISTAPYAIIENMEVIVTLYTKPEVPTVGTVEDTDIASHPRRHESSKICFPFIKRLHRPCGPSIVSNGWQGPFPWG